MGTWTGEEWEGVVHLGKGGGGGLRRWASGRGRGRIEGGGGM